MDVWNTLNISALLQVINQHDHCLLGDTGSLGKTGDSCTFRMLPQGLNGGGVDWLEVCELR